MKLVRILVMSLMVLGSVVVSAQPATADKAKAETAAKIAKAAKIAAKTAVAEETAAPAAAPVSDTTAVPTLTQRWATDTILKTPESVVFDEKYGVFYFIIYKLVDKNFDIFYGIFYCIFMVFLWYVMVFGSRIFIVL